MTRNSNFNLRRIATFGAWAAVATSIPLASAYAQTVGDDLRLASVGYRLSQANAFRCQNHTPLTGMLLHDLSGYDQRQRASIADFYKLGNGFGLMEVVPDSPGATAGLQRGDEIVSVDGIDTTAFRAVFARKASYDRMQAFNDMLDERLAKGAVELGVRRGPNTVTVKLDRQDGCSGLFTVESSRTLNAWSDGRHVAVTTRLLEFAKTDDELAFVVAHEMAHNMLGHAAQLGEGSGLFSAFGRRASKIKATEVEADQFAVRLMVRAGYEVTGAESFLNRSASSRRLDLATTHPGIRARLALVADQMARLDASDFAKPPQLAIAEVPTRLPPDDMRSMPIMTRSTDLSPLLASLTLRLAPSAPKATNPVVASQLLVVPVDSSFDGFYPSRGTGSFADKRTNVLPGSPFIDSLPESSVDVELAIKFRNPRVLPAADAVGVPAAYCSLSLPDVAAIAAPPPAPISRNGSPKA